MPRPPRQFPIRHKEGADPREPACIPRRDCIPHRGALLCVMAVTCVICGILSPCIAGVPALLGLPLGTTVWVLACQDLQGLRAGLIDPAGQRLTALARDLSVAGLLTNGLGLALSGLILWQVLSEW
jgi:hypothetical protein